MVIIIRPTHYDVWCTSCKCIVPNGKMLLDEEAIEMVNIHELAHLLAQENVVKENDV